MIEKINKVIELQKELNYEYGIINVDLQPSGEKTVLLRDLIDFLAIANGLVDESVLNSDENYYRLKTKVDEIHLMVIVSKEKYQEYKKATAPTVTKRKMSP